VAGGQNGAFLGDTFGLSTWYTDSSGELMGVAPAGVRWSSSDSSIVEPISDSTFVARALGMVTLTAEAVSDTNQLRTSLAFQVVESFQGRMVWLRQSDLGDPGRLVSRDLDSRLVVAAPPFGHPQTPHGPPALSPDGRYVAIQAARPISDIAPPAIYLVDLSTTQVVSLTDSMVGNQIVPRWSPDGASVLFSSDAGGSWNIWSVPATGGPPRVRLQLDAGAPVFFDVSPSDGRLVMALVTPEGGRDLWEASVDTGIVRRITSTPVQGKNWPRVSPDGATIAFSATADTGLGAVFLIPRAGGARREVIPRVMVPQFPGARPNANVAPSAAPSWSPDGRFVLVMWFVDATYVPASLVGAGGIDSWSYPADIYAVSTDGKVRVRLTSWVWADADADSR
jgi:Tol biopolymer transport system component